MDVCVQTLTKRAKTYLIIVHSIETTIHSSNLIHNSGVLFWYIIYPVFRTAHQFNERFRLNVMCGALIQWELNCSYWNKDVLSWRAGENSNKTSTVCWTTAKIRQFDWSLWFLSPVLGTNSSFSFKPLRIVYLPILWLEWIFKVFFLDKLQSLYKEKKHLSEQKLF